jgi:hypothetical protein
MGQPLNHCVLHRGVGLNDGNPETSYPDSCGDRAERIGQTMSVFKRGEIFQYDFWFQNRRYVGTTRQLARRDVILCEPDFAAHAGELVGGRPIEPLKGDRPR